MTVIGIVMAIYETRKNQNNLNKMSMYSCDVTVHRNYTKEEISELVIDHKRQVTEQQMMNGSLHTDNVDEIKMSDILENNLVSQNFSFQTNSED